jgi:hypothetical protein
VRPAGINVAGGRATAVGGTPFLRLVFVLAFVVLIMGVLVLKTENMPQTVTWVGVGSDVQ